MRRKLEWISPIFLIALLVQIFAPVMAGFAMAAASDSLSTAPICAEASGRTHPAPDPQHRPSDCCAFCALAHATFVAADPPPAPAPRGLLVPRPARHWASTAAPLLRLIRTTRARAPPTAS